MKKFILLFLVGFGCATYTINRNYEVCLADGNSEATCKQYKREQQKKEIEANEKLFQILDGVERALLKNSSSCCMTCNVGKPCGDSCISKEDECHISSGCAC